MDILYYGGTILTMDRNHPKCEALLIRDGIILDIGPRSYLKSLSSNLKEISLEGHTMMPAFVDGHSHMAGYGLFSKKCDLSGCASFQELTARICDYREKNGLFQGQPLLCRGYDLAILREKAHPTAALLDRLPFDNPVLCTHISGHVLVANTAAMQQCGVDSHFQDPAGGRAIRDAAGHLTGIFEEKATGAFSQLQKVLDEDRDAAILRAQQLYFAQGICTVQDGSANRETQWAAYRRLAEQGKLLVDVVIYLTADPAQKEFRQQLLNDWGRDYRHHLKIGGVKMFLDGSPQACTAYMSAPYEGQGNYRGFPVLTDAQVQEQLRCAIEEGLQPLAHCNGDAASEQFLSQWEGLCHDYPAAPRLRPCMIHAQTVRADQLGRMGAVGMYPSFFIGHTFFWGDTHLANLGARGERISPMATALQLGLPVNIHQDSPVTPPNMLHAIHCAVQRRTRSGRIVGSEERISVYEALIAATKGGAYTYFEEDRKGILRPGAVADLIVLDRDPTENADRLDQLQILETHKSGKRVYCALP